MKVLRLAVVVSVVLMVASCSLVKPVEEGGFTHPNAVVKIDGEFMDWTAEMQLDIPPNSYEEKETQAVVNDILDVFATNDERNFYVSVVFTKPFGMGWAVNFANLILLIDIDNDAATGHTTDWMKSVGVELNGEIGITPKGGSWSGLGKFTGATPADYTFAGATSGIDFKWSEMKERIEIAVSREDIGTGDKIGLVLFTSSDIGGHQQDWSPNDTARECYLYTMK